MRLKEKDPDRLVLSADKGNCVVVMDKQQYHDKALTLLNDKSTYAVLNSDPTSKTQRKLNKMLLDLKKAGKISDSTYKMLYSSDGLCPRFYGLPKIHKPGIPLRPIVLLLILRLMQFLVILREFCRLLLGILITLSKIPANLRIS